MKDRIYEYHYYIYETIDNDDSALFFLIFGIL